MESQAKSGTVKTAIEGVEVPSVIALQQTLELKSMEQGTKVAKDADVAVDNH